MRVTTSCIFIVCLLTACGDPELVPLLTDDRYRVADSGECVSDAVTGLTWERKSDNAGLHNWRNTYTWFDPDESVKEIDYRGIENGGQCAGSACDTWHYVTAVNAANTCGYNDWRLAARDELASISDLGRTHNPPTANPFAFPYMQAVEYWSGNDYSFRPDGAWAWSFQYGHDRVDWKSNAKPLRLVRGTGTQLPEVKD